MIIKLLRWLFGIHIHEWGVWKDDQVNHLYIKQIRHCLICGRAEDRIV